MHNNVIGTVGLLYREETENMIEHKIISCLILTNPEDSQEEMVEAAKKYVAEHRASEVEGMELVAWDTARSNIEYIPPGVE